EPFSVIIFVGDIVLALNDLVVIGKFGMFFENLLVFVESFFVVALSLQTAASQILSLGSVIGQRPDAGDTTSSFEREAVIFFVKGGLSDVELILGACTGPFTFADGLVRPAFARAINKRRR